MSVGGVVGGLLRGGPVTRLLQGWRRGLSVSPAVRCEAEAEAEEGEGGGEEKPEVDPAKDRSRFIPVETSINYLQSEAYQTTYGDDPVWVKYRRNFKGAFAPRKTRKTCIRKRVISAGNPCPICRDEYLVLSHLNINLLKQFISPHNNAILPTKITNICQRQNRQLVVAIEKARDMGLLTFEVPFRHYHYPDYYPPSMTADSSTSTAAVSAPPSTTAPSS